MNNMCYDFGLRIFLYSNSYSDKKIMLNCVLSQPHKKYHLLKFYL